MFNEVIDVHIDYIDKLSVPFGVIIGPCTVVSNSLQLIYDIWQKVCLRIALLFDNDFVSAGPGIGFSAKIAVFGKGGRISQDNSSQPLSPDQVDCKNYYDSLEEEVKNRLKTKALRYVRISRNFKRHLKFIGIGILRTIPVLGASAIIYYKKKRLEREWVRLE